MKYLNLKEAKNVYKKGKNITEYLRKELNITNGRKPLNHEYRLIENIRHFVKYKTCKIIMQNSHQI